MASQDRRSAAEIEREIEADRQALDRTLDEIRGRLSLDRIPDEIIDRMRDGGWDLGRSILRKAGENPAPLALAAASLAWLLVSRHPPQEGRATAGSRPDDDTPAPAAFIRDPGAADAAQTTAEEMREGIMRGTEDMSRTARQRVLAARTRAYEAQLEAERQLVPGRKGTSDLFGNHPLVVGALALAAGAALGSLVPRRTTSRANEVEVHSKHAVTEAERIFRHERAKTDEARSGDEI